MARADLPLLGSAVAALHPALAVELDLLLGARAPLPASLRSAHRCALAGAGVQCHRRSAVAQGAGAGDRALARTPPHPCADLRTDSARSQPVDIVCYLLIMAGISLDAAYLPTSPRKIDVRSAQSFRSALRPLRAEL